MITEMKAGHLKDIDKPSEPFEVIGKIIPRYENENWTFTELLYEAPYLKSYQDEEYEDEQSPEKIIELYAECIRLFHSIDISDCPYTNSLDSRLAELDYLLNNDLADVDCENWEEDTPFKDPRELYDFLKTEKPEEELVFSHGDLGDSNIFVKDGKVSGFIDLGRSGRADKWYDIAFCVRSIREDIGEEQYVELFFDLLGIKPDWEKIKYYILLDELF